MKSLSYALNEANEVNEITIVDAFFGASIFDAIKALNFLKVCANSALKDSDTVITKKLIEIWKKLKQTDKERLCDLLGIDISRIKN